MREKKICYACKQKKGLRHFYIDRSKRDRHSSECKECRKNRRKEEYSKRESRRTNLLYYFGMTAEDYDVILKQQDGVCAICGKPESSTYKGETRRLAIDHDHKTNKIRGLLCTRCNSAMGMIHENQSTLIRMLSYLKERAKE